MAFAHMVVSLNCGNVQSHLACVRHQTFQPNEWMNSYIYTFFLFFVFLCYFSYWPIISTQEKMLFFFGFTIVYSLPQSSKFTEDELDEANRNSAAARMCKRHCHHHHPSLPDRGNVRLSLFLSLSPPHIEHFLYTNFELKQIGKIFKWTARHNLHSERRLVADISSSKTLFVCLNNLMFSIKTSLFVAVVVVVTCVCMLWDSTAAWRRRRKKW